MVSSHDLCIFSELLADIGDYDFLAEQAVAVGLFEDSEKVKAWLDGDEKRDVGILALSAHDIFLTVHFCPGDSQRHQGGAASGYNWRAVFRYQLPRTCECLSFLLAIPYLILLFPFSRTRNTRSRGQRTQSCL